MSSRGPGHRSRSRGVSLIEAIVALAVMGFGMLGIAAMQSSLRQNSDTARQRAEATRLASEAIEAMRSYSVVNTAGGKIAYADLVTGVAAPQLALPSTIAGTNATYTRTVEVSDTDAQNRKTVFVKITWDDRSGQPQELVLSTEIHRSPPELAASLIVPASGTATQLPGGRHPTIPQAAIDNGDGTSSFTPPGFAPGVADWVFNNTTGVIQDCGPLKPCPTGARLLSGSIAFSIDGDPNGTSEAPPSLALPAFTSTPPTAGIIVVQTKPAPPPSAPDCYYERLPASPAATRVIAYYCAVAVNNVTTPSYVWSGSAILSPLPATYETCRYSVDTGTAPMRNRDHPLVYTDVNENLVNQNFLVVLSTYHCPSDNVITPLGNFRISPHQPPLPASAPTP
ncbi:MAG: prepilin-type N-terminal cleavage/methylation domain-containing protein [Burkholderiales bacterium]|nr:prepilin-type N-terminal cleavage/methylation domain-containing protein [Burkholderiales bacterium]